MLINAVDREATLGVLINLCYNSERSGADEQERRWRWRWRWRGRHGAEGGETDEGAAELKERHCLGSSLLC